eukprot:SAG31_NODE_5_length_43735_cov_42.922266_13_plen_173_part_00
MCTLSAFTGVFKLSLDSCFQASRKPTVRCRHRWSADEHANKYEYQAQGDELQRDLARALVGLLQLRLGHLSASLGPLLPRKRHRGMVYGVLQLRALRHPSTASIGWACQRGRNFRCTGSLAGNSKKSIANLQQIICSGKQIICCFPISLNLSMQRCRLLIRISSRAASGIAY